MTIKQLRKVSGGTAVFVLCLAVPVLVMGGNAMLQLTQRMSVTEWIGFSLGYSPPPLTTWRKYSRELVACRQLAHAPQKTTPDAEMEAACQALMAADDADMAAVDRWQAGRIKAAGAGAARQ